ncbi:MAG: S8 family serine peptidase [Bacteroidales bacterium]|nr:S8 family serine peptidase [Bacteroidales bacterium]
MKKNYIVLFLALVLSTLTFAQNFSAIEPELQNVLGQKSEELIDIQIYFKSSIDSKQLNQAARKAYTKAEKKEFVVNELKAYSENAQADVMSILTAEELSGNVSDIHNLWIANSISCKASASVVYKLSSHPDVKMIGYDKEMQVISPEQMEEIKSDAKSDVRAGGPDAHVQAVEAHRVWWEKGYTGKNVVVAVLDSGTNINHLDLKDHLWTGYVDTNKDGNPDTYVNGWNFVNNSSNITDDYGHGTHCAGIVCGDGTSMITTGIAPDASLMTLKIVNRAGGGSVTQMLNGVQFAVENGADVLSMSLGFKNSQLTTTQKETIRSTFDNVLETGVIVCAAAGNDGNTYGAPNNVDYPAACPAPWRNPDQTLEGGLSSVICVGAHDLNESSRGPSTWEGTSYNDYPYEDGAQMGLIRPDISAPGYIIRSTKYSRNDIYELKSGTSQATPCVAGVIALMLEKNSTLTPAQISEIIETTATSKPETKNNNVGAGIVNALAAVNSITETVGNPYVQVNTFTPESFSTGNQTIGVTLKNKGAGASDENTSVTLSLSNDPYVTIANPTQTLGRLGVNATKTLFFELNIDENTPSGHTATFSIKTTSGNFSWDEIFSVKISTVPSLAFKSVSPGVVKYNETAEIHVTMVNDGTAAFTSPISLKLLTTSYDLKYVTLIDDETTIPALGVGETGTGTFTIETKQPIHPYDFFLDTYAESNAGGNYIYEFENDMEGWTCFKAGTCFTKEPWMHSTSAITLTNVKDSHSGEGHLMSISNQNGVAQLYSPINNYIVSPSKVKVTENSKVSFYASGNNTYGYKEHFGVAVSTSGNTSESYFTTIDEWIISEKTTWTKYTVDLSAYAGQEIYVAIRHFFTAQEWEDSYYGYDYDALNIDDITFENVVMKIQHTSTLSYDDPYYFNVTASNSVVLPTVENVTATALSGSKVELTWNAVENVKSYNVYRDGQNIASVTEPTFVDTELAYDTEYCYTVTTVTSNGESAFSDKVCATTLEPAEAAAPTNLAAVAESESMIVLTWDEVAEATSYNVYQEAELIASELTSAMYIVDNLEANTEYCFSVTSVNKLGESEKSESTCATTLKAEGTEPEVPTLATPVVTAEATSDTTILLTWEAVENAARYNIYSGDSVVKLAVNATSYTVDGLEAGTQYCFNVIAINRDAESEKSEDACATTLKVEEPEQPADSTKLAAPTNLRAAIRQDVPGYNYKYEITMMWDAVEGAQGYDVYVNTTKEQDFYFGYTGGTAYVAGSNEETTFEFYIVAFNDDLGLESEPSEICTVTVVDDAIEEMNASFNIYPNPVNDKLYIETLTQTQTVEIYDVYGRRQNLSNLATQQLSNSIDVTGLNSGVYFVKVRTENGETVKRFIKQ